MGSGQVSPYCSITCGWTIARFVWGRAPREPALSEAEGSKLSEAQQRRPRQPNLASASEREQERRSSCDASHGQTGSLHGLIDGGLMWPHPGVFRIMLWRGGEHREAFGGF